MTVKLIYLGFFEGKEFLNAQICKSNENRKSERQQQLRDINTRDDSDKHKDIIT